MTANVPATIYRGHLLFTKKTSSGADLISESDGALLVDDKGAIIAVGGYADLKPQNPNATEVSYGDAFIMPGFVDGHLHFPQMAIIGSWGEKLLNWLDKYTYPEEQKFADNSYAAKWANRFTNALLKNGTTTAGIFSSNHLEATDILFSEADRRGLRAVIGKTSMDQNAPSPLCRGPELDGNDQNFLIKKWHRTSKYCSFAINPRFAISCSEKLLRSLGDLKEKYPDAFVQTHFAENLDEIAAVKALFPKEKNYLSVYDKFGLLSADTLLGHGIHPTSEELDLLARKKTAIVHCPSSNNFLGSGFCKVPSLISTNQRVCLGSDIGGGTSFSMFASMREAYYIQKQSGSSLTPATLLHLATHSGSEILNRNTSDSCFIPGLPADFVVVKWRNSELLSQRLENAPTDNDRLFATIILGDDRIVNATYVGGRKVYNQSTHSE